MENNKSIIWVDCRDLKNNREIFNLSCNLSMEYLLMKFEDIDKIKLPKKVKPVVEVNLVEQLKNLSEDYIVFSKNRNVLDQSKKKNYKTAYLTKIIDQNTMNEAWDEGMNYDYLVVELISDTNIPLELLIAKLQKNNTVLIKKVKTALEAEIAGGVMDVGSDGVLLCTSDLNELVNADNLIKKQLMGKINLVKAKVVNVQHVGMGFRACIDTVSILNMDEGMLVGSTSSGGLLVSSETHYLPYMNLRPFRVNAGAVHSYVWCPNNETAYITELKGGSKINCVDVEGNTREVCIGRIKTERRPLLKIEVEANGQKINAFIQDDWHIRVFGGDKEPKNSSDIKVGDELLAYLCEAGRHVGIKIEESIEEI